MAPTANVGVSISNSISSFLIGGADISSELALKFPMEKFIVLPLPAVTQGNTSSRCLLFFSFSFLY